MGMANSHTVKKDDRAFSRILPPLAFVFALLMLIILCYDSGYTSLPPTEKRYVAAKARITSLKDDAKKNIQREPWEKLATEFKSIYDSDPAWPNRPAALYKAAESLEELAIRSCSKADAKKAISCYESVALRHASSRLADDALYRAAHMRAAILRDDKGALALLARLKRQYPSGDMLKQAVALENALLAASKGRTAPEAIKTVSTPATDTMDEPRKSSSQKNFSGDLPLRYKAAVSRMNALKNDSLKACWRQPWENLRDEFAGIAKAGKNRLAPSALFNAAACQEAIAVCSRLSKDYKTAVEMYSQMAKKYPAHAEAANALLNAAKLQRSRKETSKAAVATLEKMVSGYPKSSFRKDASTLLAKWKKEDAPAPAIAQAAPEKKTTEKPELQVLSWDSPNKNRVEIVLENVSAGKIFRPVKRGRDGRSGAAFS